ncbi:MAG: YhgE/Pip family protein [Dorea sp.]
MLFMAVGLVQGLIVCLGDIVLLKVQCVHPVAFVCVGIFCSFIYVNLIYALALTFKHIGKALGVVLVILQIPGSAGTYPIEMTPAFFQKLHPLLPFTYGISAMRECIAGMYGSDYLKISGDSGNLLYRYRFFIGLVLRPLLMNLNHLFDKQLVRDRADAG